MTSWTVNPSPDYCGARIDGADGRSVAHAVQRDAHPTIGQGITQAQALANARLIAAAPELLAAAEAAIAYHGAIASCADDPEKMSSFCTAQGDDLDSLYADWIFKAASAVAKATGVAA